MAYTPVVLTKGARTEIAESLEEYYILLFDGWSPNGPGPAIPRSQVPATLADIDSLTAAGNSSGLLASVTNQSQVAITFTSTPTAIFGTVLEVPPSIRPVTLKWGAGGSIAAVPSGGHGFAALGAYAIDGTPSAVDYSVVVIRSTDAVNDTLGSWYYESQIGPSATWRKYQLYGLCNKSAAATTYPQAKVTNYVGIFKTWFAAEAK